MNLRRLISILGVISIVQSQVINKNLGNRGGIEDDAEFVELKDGLLKQQQQADGREKSEQGAGEPADVIAANANANAESGDNAAEQDGSALPPSLNSKNFDRVLSSGVHFVEFFSPYCTHCKALAPIWEEFYKSYRAEGEAENIFLHQVDCVANGDLCLRESISTYPNIRLYVPNEAGTAGSLTMKYPDEDPRTAEAFINFLREQALDAKDAGYFKTSKSTLLTPSEMVAAIAGHQGQPYLVSFWPTTNEELNDDNFDVVKIPKSSRCNEFKTVWSQVSNQVGVKTGTFNCRSNPKICKALGLSDLTKTTERGMPAVYMFLPSEYGGNKIRYKSYNKAKFIVEWAKRLQQIYNVEEVTFNSLKTKMKLAPRLQREASTESAINSKISFVYLYDKDAYVTEDELIFGQLIQPIMDLNTEVYLYKSSDMKFLSFLEKQHNSLLEYIHYNETESQQPFNKKRFVSETASSLPTWLCFKDNSLISQVFPSRSARDVRDYGKAFNFIKSNALPLVEELNEMTFNSIFYHYPPNSAGFFTEDDKVVISFVDSTDFNGVFETIYQSSLLAHDYHNLRQNLMFTHLDEERESKRTKAQKVKDDGGDSVDYRHALNRRLGLFDPGKIVPVYLDLKKNSALLDKWGWNRLHKRDIKPGDAIVVSRYDAKKMFWDKDIYGAPLSISKLRNLRDTIAALNFEPKLFVPSPKYSMPKWKYVSGTFGEHFAFLDGILTFKKHSYMGSALLVIVVAVVLLHLRRRRRMRSQKLRGLGILGKIPSPPNSNGRPGKFD
ncbi:unnamed protein product [Kuraishia capsulata CBS 1993]|uniref:Thioredoxin domain-containing protein n=1 Tax=Kuraishia capsulata CBS 1993 TaxID=1382522 RepID=W6MIZ0_9ASCO|nr:uncharacterized protein KUCA_T00002441001 [Kuraishia capsulata CBS 1993]CDK26469.1 unnamed protein product [Kuraishia capsulata CBS 1993]